MLVVEIAQNTNKKEKFIKLPLYAQAGFPQFWLANLQQKEIEAYRKPRAIPIQADAFKEGIAVSQIFE